MSHCAHFSTESRSLQWINQNQDWHRKALSLHTRNSVLRCYFTVVPVNPSTCNFVSHRKPSRLKTLTVQMLHTCCNNVRKRLFIFLLTNSILLRQIRFILRTTTAHSKQVTVKDSCASACLTTSYENLQQN